MYVRLCLLACIRVYLTLLDVCMYIATYFSHVIKKLTHAPIIPFGVLFCTCLYINIGCLGCCYVYNPLWFSTLDDDACAQDTNDNAVPNGLDYCNTPEGFEMVGLYCVMSYIYIPD